MSRIEFSQYGYGEMGLRIEISAAVNPGDSGGPALVNAEMVGLVFGAAVQALRPDGEVMSDMAIAPGALDRLSNRKSLLGQLDRVRRAVDAQRDAGIAENGAASDTCRDQALDILTSSRIVQALDLERENPRVRAAYGADDPNVLPYSHLGYRALMSRFLLARRLIEAGVRCVTVSFADFDWHGSNFAHGRKVLPLFDQGITALVDDLHDRGLADDVSVVAWGEFGRTPRINKDAGRDHWPQVSCALLAGGGMRTGQVIGSTNRWAETAVDRPVQYAEVLATLYHNLGLEVRDATLRDLNGRPRYLLDQYAPISELA